MPLGPLSRTEPGRARRSLEMPRRLLAGGPGLARRLVHFWIVWSVLLLVHEGGHALVARRQGLDLERVTVGVGPALWRGASEDTRFVLRLLPLAGLTEVEGSAASVGRRSEAGGWSAWSRQAATLSGGVAATLVLVLILACIAALWERGARRRCLWGRIVIADALVLSVFNLLPVPPLDGGRALLAGVSALRGAPLSGDALFWLQVGGLALAVVPMALWTSWTRRIDAFALRWRAPERRARQVRSPERHAPEAGVPQGWAPENEDSRRP